eukprot:3207997-Rhodomonas_salina.2
MALRRQYAVSGTDEGYAATSRLRARAEGARGRRQLHHVLGAGLTVSGAGLTVMHETESSLSGHGHPKPPFSV